MYISSDKNLLLILSAWQQLRYFIPYTPIPNVLWALNYFGEYDNSPSLNHRATLDTAKNYIPYL